MTLGTDGQAQFSVGVLLYLESRLHINRCNRLGVFFSFYRCDACILKKRDGGGETGEVESEKRETGSVCTWQTESCFFCILKGLERCRRAVHENSDHGK